MPLENATPQQTSIALVERLANALLDLAGDQEVRVIEALAAVLARHWRDGDRSPLRGLFEPTAPWQLASEPSDPDRTKRHAICQRIARRALRGSLMDPTRGATAMHRIDVSPAWSRDLLPTGMFGPFLFYRPTPPRARANEWLGASDPGQQEIAGLDW
jgi:Cell Wall Hydrolase